MSEVADLTKATDFLAWSIRKEIGGVTVEGADRSFWMAYDSFVSKHARRPVVMLLHPETMAQFAKHEIAFPEDIDPVPVRAAEFVTRGHIWMPVTNSGQPAKWQDWKDLPGGEDAGEGTPAKVGGQVHKLVEKAEGQKPRPAGTGKAKGTATVRGGQDGGSTKD